MKTFKLVSLQFMNGDTLTDTELLDGLIINREIEENSWILEAYTTTEHVDTFDRVCQSGEWLTVQAVITKPTNAPAPFQVQIRNVQRINDLVSVLFRGHIIHAKHEYAELLLAQLLKDGLQGEELLKSFTNKIHASKPITKVTVKPVPPKPTTTT
ncbi:YwpF family protein [Bacillus fonticola]|uniref:YwpF family protein n=1 Tax=Bacillus fonticola TaxID=2728853 RepID=UPI001474F0EE|nr:YwpF family protein [Bacillus fonticola]